MTEKFIPIVDQRQHTKEQPRTMLPLAPTGALLDQLHRPMRDLRISVTDRCNFRCVYCMPKEVFNKDYTFLPHSSLLSFEEIARLARLFVAHGVRKIRLTGGEPLLRKNIEKLIEQLRAIRCVDNSELDISLTTNGALLAQKAHALKAAGLNRVTVSLDSLDDACFKKMNDVDFPVLSVLEGINAAHEAGLGPIKINMVVKAGLNDQEIVPMAQYFKETPHILRFIEYMDVGASNQWKLDEVISSQQIVERIQQAGYALSKLTPNYESETAERWRYADSGNEIGIISSVTKAFCRNCTRARLSTEGKLYTCLFASNGFDLRTLLREKSSTDADVSAVLGTIWQARADRYSELRSSHSSIQHSQEKKIEMSYIGG
jgi:GTP 3',8-cyclase